MWNNETGENIPFTKKKTDPDDELSEKQFHVKDLECNVTSATLPVSETIYELFHHHLKPQKMSKKLHLHHQYQACIVVNWTRPFWTHSLSQNLTYLIN